MGCGEVEGKLEDGKERELCLVCEINKKIRIKEKDMLPSLLLQLYSHSLIISAYSVLSSPLNQTIFITPIVQIAEIQTY